MKTKLKTTLALLAAFCGLQLFTATPAMADDPTPPSVLDSAYLWLDASQGVTTDGSGMVTSWTSRNSGGKTATSYTQSTQVTAGPTVLTGVLGGKNVVDFGAARSHKDLQFTESKTIRTVFMVAAVATDSNNIFFLGDNTSGSKTYNFHRGGSGYYFDSSHGSKFTGTGGTRRNGVAISSPASTTVPTSYGLYTLTASSDATANCICQDRDQADRNGGKKVAELIIFNKTLTDDERNAVESYLMTKWLSGYSEQTMLYRLGLDSNGDKSTDSTGKQTTTTEGTITHVSSGMKFDTGCVKLSSNGSYVIDNIETTKDQGWTLSFWFSSDVGTWKDLLAFAIGNKMGKFERNGGSDICIYQASSLAADKIEPSNNPVASGFSSGWNHLALVSTSAGFDVYLNGVKKSSVTQEFDSGLTKVIIGTKGYNGDGRTSNALVDDVSVFNWPMTSVQINKIKNSSTHASMDLFAASKATVTEDINWSNLTWTPSKPASGEDVKLTREGDAASATLTLNESVNVGCLTVESAAGKELKIANFDSNLTATSFDFGTAKGGVGIDVTSGWTVTDTLRRYIRDNEAKVKFYGANDTGATLTYDLNLNRSIQGHWIFEGGKHALTYGNSVQNATVFGANATADNPTILVKNGTTLDFTGKDLCGWSGAVDINGIIAVENGGKINFINSGTGSIYYRQRLTINPGGEICIKTTQGDGSDNDLFRLQGGCVENKEQIYVPASTAGSPEAKITAGNGGSHDGIRLAADNTKGIGVFVGENSTLSIANRITSADANEPIGKYGAGTLKLNGTMSGFTSTFTVSAGTLTVPAGSLACPLTLSASGATVNITGETGLDEYVITSGTFTPGSGTVLLNGAALSGYVVDGNKIVKSLSYAAKIGDTKYETVAEAMTAVTSGQTITLLKSVEETLTAKTTDFTLALDGHTLSGSLAVPTDSAITLNLGSGTLSSTLTGSGTIIYDGGGTATELPTAPTGLTAANWTGTVWFKGYTKNQFNFSSFANTNSKIKLTGFKGYAPDPTSASTVNDFEFILEDDGDTKALTINDGYSNKSYGFYFGKLTGTGTFTNSKGVSHCYCIKDGASFAGTIATTGPLVVFGETVVAKPNDDLGYIFVQNGKTATIAANKTWSATHGLFVNEGGTIAGSGTFANAMTFENNATIDTRNGVLTAGGSLTFGAHTKIRVATEPVPGTPIKVINKTDAGTAAVPTSVTVYVGESETPFTTYAFGLAYKNDGLYLNVFSAFTAEVSGDTDWSAISWTPDPKGAFPANAELIITNTGDSATITMDADVTVAELLLVSASEKETTFEAGGGAVSVGVYEFEEAAGKVTVGFSTGAASVAAGSDTVLAAEGTGTLTISAEKQATVPSWDWSKISNAGTFALNIADTLALSSVCPLNTGTLKVVGGTLSVTTSGSSGNGQLPCDVVVDGASATLQFNAKEALGWNADTHPITLMNNGTMYNTKIVKFKRPLVLAGGKVQALNDAVDEGRIIDFDAGSSIRAVAGTESVIGGTTAGSIVNSGRLVFRSVSEATTFTVESDATLRIYSQFGWTGNNCSQYLVTSVNKAGPGKLVTYRAPLQTGAFALNGGTLSLAGEGRPTTGTITAAADTTIELGLENADQTVENVIAGAGAVNKVGTGTTTLSGANTYSGETVVESGTLILTGSSIGSGAYTVASGATLDIGTNRGLTIDGAGNVVVTLTAEQYVPGGSVTVFTAGATTPTIVLKDSEGNEIPSSYYTLSGTTVTFKREATIDGTDCFTLAQAIAQATSGQTITLLTNCTIAEEVLLAEGVTLDFNTHTITVDASSGIVFFLYGTLTDANITLKSGNLWLNKSQVVTLTDAAEATAKAYVILDTNDYWGTLPVTTQVSYAGNNAYLGWLYTTGQSTTLYSVAATIKDGKVYLPEQGLNWNDTYTGGNWHDTGVWKKRMGSVAVATTWSDGTTADVAFASTACVTVQTGRAVSPANMTFANGGLITNNGTFGAVTIACVASEVSLAGSGQFGTITLRNVESTPTALNIGSLRNLEIAGAGKVNVTLTDAEYVAGKTTTLFTLVDGATTSVGTIKDSSGNEIPSSYYTLNGATITFKKEAKIGSTYYFTLKQAIETPEAGTAIEMVADVTDTQTINVTKAITFDGGTNILSNVTFEFSGSGALTLNTGCIGIDHVTGMTLSGGCCRFTADSKTTWDVEGVRPSGYTLVQITAAVRGTYDYEFVKSGFEPEAGKSVIPVADQNGDAGVIKLDSAWVAEKTPGATTAEDQARILNTPQNNGLMKWQNDVLGLTGTDPDAKPVVHFSQSQSKEDKIAFTLNGVDGDSGATVKFRVYSADTPGASAIWTAASEETSSTAAAEVALPTTQEGVKYYRYDVITETSK